VRRGESEKVGREKNGKYGKVGIEKMRIEKMREWESEKGKR
jgi:hypothetical protein